MDTRTYKLSEIVNGFMAVRELQQAVESYEGSLCLARMARSFELEYKGYADKNKELVEKYGRLPKKGVPEEEKLPEEKRVFNTDKNWALYQKEHDELLAKKVEITFTPIKESDLKGQRVLAAYFDLLFPFHEEGMPAADPKPAKKE